jgi:hypothetical protein
MITIRRYRKADASSVGGLIANTYGEFNLSYAPSKERTKLLGPFHYARSRQQGHRDAIVQVLRAPVILVAEDNGEIVRRVARREKRQATDRPAKFVCQEKPSAAGHRAKAGRAL